MTNHERYAELAALHALGALDGSDLVDFEIHLRGCLECRRAGADLGKVVAGLAPEGPPPAALRDRIREKLPAGRSQGPSWVVAVAVAAVLLVCVGMFLQVSAMRAKLRVTEDDLARANDRVEALNRALTTDRRTLIATLRDRDELRRVASLVCDGKHRELKGADGSAVVFWDPKGGGVVFMPRGMQELKPGERFVLWMISDKPVAVADAVQVHTYGYSAAAPAALVGAMKKLAVSVESEARPEKPSARILMIGDTE